MTPIQTDWSSFFALVNPPIAFASITGGFIMGYVFMARLSTHVSIPLLLLRLIVTGLTFIAILAMIRLLGGVAAWPSWLGAAVAWGIYCSGITAGVVMFERNQLRKLERTWGRSLRHKQVDTPHRRRKEDGKEGPMNE